MFSDRKIVSGKEGSQEECSKIKKWPKHREGNAEKCFEIENWPMTETGMRKSVLR